MALYARLLLAQCAVTSYKTDRLKLRRTARHSSRRALWPTVEDSLLNVLVLIQCQYHCLAWVAQEHACNCTSDSTSASLLAHRACLLFLQAIFTADKERTAALPAAAQGPARITLRITNHAPSELHIRQLKSNSIGAAAGSCMVRMCMSQHCARSTSKL